MFEALDAFVDILHRPIALPGQKGRLASVKVVTLELLQVWSLTLSSGRVSCHVVNMDAVNVGWR